MPLQLFGIEAVDRARQGVNHHIAQRYTLADAMLAQQPFLLDRKPDVDLLCLSQIRLLAGRFDCLIVFQGRECVATTYCV